MPISRNTVIACGRTKLGCRPALKTSKRSPASWRSRPSAIWLRATLPVQTISTFCLSIDPSDARGGSAVPLALKPERQEKIVSAGRSPIHLSHPGAGQSRASHRTASRNQIGAALFNQTHLSALVQQLPGQPGLLRAARRGHGMVSN